MPIYIFSTKYYSNDEYDGVGLAQREIFAEISGNNGSFKQISLEHLIADPLIINSLGPEDTVYCNLDPYAYYLHYAREIVGGEFRIIRNVQTGLWNGYLLQEWLCDPLTRPDDIILYISEYANKVFSETNVPFKRSGQHVVCYPELLGFPTLFKIPTLEKRPYQAIYLGRLSRDKGFEEVIEIFKRLHAINSQSRFCIVGDVHPLDYSDNEIENTKKEVTAFGVEWSSSVPHNNVFELLLRSQALIFPSTSNVESLGRVILEAAHCGTPVISAAHSEAQRLVPPKNLVDPRYKIGQIGDPIMHYPLGSPDPDDFVDLLTGPTELCNYSILSERKEHWQLFQEILVDRQWKLANKKQTISKNMKIPQMNINDVTEIDVKEAMQKIKILFKAHRSLVLKKYLPSDVVDKLRKDTTQPTRTERFLDKVNYQSFRSDDIGAFPIEACHLVEFHPILITSGVF